MKKVVLVLGLLMTSSILFTSCRDESKVEQAADDAGDAIEDAGDDVEDAVDDM
ncbi:hypothetical protein [Salinimicrobium sp. GXAS 041]|uniref:hypothetical protein n=1 Tax=Salinimicrobium sp. GXAS 041 TaxID=3400806 RepID=UPI003C789EFC